MTHGEHESLPDPDAAPGSLSLGPDAASGGDAASRSDPAPGALSSDGDAAQSSRLSRLLLGLGIFGMFGLSLLANAPLAGVDVPPGVGTLLCTCALILCGLRFRDGGADEKVAAGAVTLALLHLASEEGIFSVGGSADLASLLAARFSSTLFGYPMLGLVYSWVLLGAGFLSTRAVKQLARDEGVEGRAVGWLAIFVGALASVFGLRALIGYVSGSTSFFG